MVCQIWKSWNNTNGSSNNSINLKTTQTSSVVRQPQIRVLKQLVAKLRGLTSAMDAADGDGPAALASGQSSDSLGIEDVANQDWDMH